MTAIRETFEETGVLLLASEPEELQELPQRSPPPSPSLSEAALDASRESIHTGRTLFRDFLKEHALSADVKALLPFTEWITPLGSSRCVLALACMHPPLTLTHPTMLTTATTAASTRVSTSLSCPLSARPSHSPAGGSHHHHHFHRE